MVLSSASTSGKTRADVKAPYIRTGHQHGAVSLSKVNAVPRGIQLARGCNGEQAKAVPFRALRWLSRRSGNPVLETEEKLCAAYLRDGEFSLRLNLRSISIGRLVALGLILLSFPVILLLDIYVTPWRIPSTVIYAIPIIIASRFFGKVILFIVLSVGLAFEFIDALLEETDPQTAALSAVSLLVIGMLSLFWAEAERRAVSIAAERARFDDTEHHRVFEMATPRRSVSGLLTAGSFAPQSLANGAIRLLGIAIAIIYVWFGALKILGVSPVSELVEKMSVGISRETFVRFVGVWELVIGVAFIFRVALHLTLPLFFLQLAGTFLTFVFHPREVYQRGNPLLLTQIGEFIVKNFVLLAAGIVIGSSVRKKPDRLSLPSDGLD